MSDATQEFWPDRPDHAQINEAMSTAANAFNAAYFESQTTAELATNAQATLGALATVLRLTGHIAPEYGWVSPEEHRSTEQALSMECAGRHAAEERATKAEAKFEDLDDALRAHAPRDVRHAVLAYLAEPDPT